MHVITHADHTYLRPNFGTLEHAHLKTSRFRNMNDAGKYDNLRQESKGVCCLEVNQVFKRSEGEKEVNFDIPRWDNLVKDHTLKEL